MEDSQRPIRIAFVEPYNGFYGAQQSLFTLITNLPRSQVDPIFVTPFEGIQAERYRGVGIDVVVLPIHSIVNQFGGKIRGYNILKKFRVIWEIFRYNIRFLQLVREKQVDVVYANDARAVMYVCVAVKLSRIPLIWYVRIGGRPSVFSRLGLRLADRVILISNGVKDIFPEGDRIRFGRKLHVLHTGFAFKSNRTEDRFATRQLVRAEYRIPPDCYLIGLVGSISHRKGHDLLVEAIGYLRAREVDCAAIFVGDSPSGDPEKKYEAFVREVARKLGVEDRVYWAGRHDDVDRFYDAIDVLALPSRSEGLPRVVIEALAAGVPVVASDVGGVRDILIEDELGLVIPPNDSKALAVALLEVYRNRDLFSEDMRRKRAEFVEERFTIESYVTGFVRIVKQLSPVGSWEPGQTNDQYANAQESLGSCRKN